MKEITLRIRDLEIADMLKRLANANHSSINSYIVQLIARDAAIYKRKTKDIPLLQRALND